MKIVHVIARLNVGGAALHVLHLAHEQMQLGHEVVVVAGTLANGEQSMAYVADELGVSVHDLPVLQRELSLRSDLAAIRALRALIRERRPDVVHTHTAKAGATGRAAALIAGRARPRALVHSYHGHVLTGYFSPGRERVFRGIERVLARRTSALIAVSNEIRDDLVALKVAPHDRFKVVPYGFDFPDWGEAYHDARRRVRSEIGLADETFAIGWVGRLTAIKRPHDLVRTLRAVLDQDVDAVLVLVGDGEERPSVEALAAELGVADRCRLVGFQQGIRDWYAAVDVTILTSANEGTPVAAIESLGAGRPVVATDVGGTAAAVLDGETGYLVPMGDIDALAERLVGLARDPGRRTRMGLVAAEDVRERFATKRMVTAIEAVYRQSLA
jgi:glycosyltransferase involved in cell wall biosynthesis